MQKTKIVQVFKNKNFKQKRYKNLYLQVISSFLQNKLFIDRSIVQFSKESYPVIGNATSVKIPILRTGSCQKKSVAVYKTVEGTAKPGVDFDDKQV